MYKISLILFLASCAGMSSMQAEEIEEGVSYPYPFFNEDAESISSIENLPKKEKKEESKTARTAQVGRVKFSADVQNADYLSQCQSDWEKMQKEKNPKREKSSRSRKEREEEDHSPKAVFSFKWSSDD
jgi:hypothetical protein